MAVISRASARQIAEHPETQRFVRFVLVGLLNTSIDFTLFFLFTHVAGWHYLLANVASFLLAAINSYFMNRRWTFGSQSAAWHREAAQYVTVLVIGFALNEGLLFLLVSRWQWAKLIAKVMVTGLVLVWNFSANRLWTFRHVAAD